MATARDPIFVLDSGLGGLTVVRAIRHRLPNERVIYFGDTARLPYGSKTRQTVGGFVRQILAWAQQWQPKHVVIACNTASALALDDVREAFPDLPISGVIRPGAAAAAAAVVGRVRPGVGVIATEATVRSEAYQTALADRSPHARLQLRATPLLVALIEEGRAGDDPVVELALRQYLAPMIAAGIDALVLGCTHYPLLRAAIQRVVGNRVAVIDSAERCAEDVAARLDVAGLRAGPTEGSLDSLRLFVTDDPGRFGELAPRFLGFDVDRPEHVAPEILYDTSARPAARPSLRLRA